MSDTGVVTDFEQYSAIFERLYARPERRPALKEKMRALGQGATSKDAVNAYRDAAGRSCDGCALCCKLQGVAALAKPLGRWCEHCVEHAACGIYERRPQECAGFACAWVLGIGPDWLKPSDSGALLHFEFGLWRLRLDATRFGKWRDGRLGAFVRKFISTGVPLVILEGDAAYGVPSAIALDGHTLTDPETGKVWVTFSDANIPDP